MREIDYTFTFEAAHRLTEVPPSHKCARMHGHSFTAVVWVEGKVDARGMVLDFDAVKCAFEPLHMQLDHNTLNDVAGLDNPTSENIAEWIYGRMVERFKALGFKQKITRVHVKETCRSGASYP